MKKETLVLESYEGSWPDDDPDAGFRSMVREYSRLDPLITLENLGRSKNIPVGALVKFILARYTASGSDAILEMGPVVIQQMGDMVDRAEAEATDRARLEAYASLKAVVSWLRVPVTDPNWRPGERRASQGNERRM